MNAVESTPRRVLVTGVAGFIGFHVAERLLQDGATVLGMDSINNYYDVRLKDARLQQLSVRSGLTFEKVDVADDQAVIAAFEKFRPQYVVHLAAQAGVRYSLTNPKAYARSNIDGFLSILEACRSHPVRHLIYASSSSVYGTNAQVPFRETDPVEHPVSLYAATKRANELMAETYAHLFRVPASGLRLFTVYGPWGRPDMAYYSFTKAIIEGKPIDVFNHGRMQRDFTYIDDVVEAIVRLIEAPPLTEGAAPPHVIYNVGNHTPIELDRFINVIESAVGRTAERRYLPMQPGDVPATYADVRRLTAAVGFAPRTTIEHGIGQFVAWYRGHYGV